MQPRRRQAKEDDARPARAQRVDMRRPWRRREADGDDGGTLVGHCGLGHCGLGQ